MPTSIRPNRLNIDLQHLKQPWLEFCKANRVTPSEAIRQIISKVMKAAPTESRTGEDTQQRSHRHEIRLTPREHARVTSLAASEGFATSRWIVALIRARLEHTPQLGQRELEVLAQSNLQMLAIGRSLNQLARAANSAITIETNGRDLISELKKAVMHHADQVASVMTSNVARWSK